jgi:hypothetical protein
MDLTDTKSLNSRPATIARFCKSLTLRGPTSYIERATNKILVPLEGITNSINLCMSIDSLWMRCPTLLKWVRLKAIKAISDEPIPSVEG